MFFKYLKVKRISRLFITVTVCMTPWRMCEQTPSSPITITNRIQISNQNTALSKITATCPCTPATCSEAHVTEEQLSASVRYILLWTVRFERFNVRRKSVVLVSPGRRTGRIPQERAVKWIIPVIITPPFTLLPRVEFEW